MNYFKLIKILPKSPVILTLNPAIAAIDFQAPVNVIGCIAFPETFLVAQNAKYITCSKEQSLTDGRRPDSELAHSARCRLGIIYFPYEKIKHSYIER